jgi:hypothetical protein
MTAGDIRCSKQKEYNQTERKLVLSKAETC